MNGTSKTKRRSAYEEFMALSDSEKTESVKEFDQEFIIDKTKPLTPAQRRQWNRARRRGRPRVGAGAAKVLVSVEKTLLKKADALAKQEGISRSQLFARGLSIMLQSRRKAG
jgi:hypothetical protein